MASGTDVTVRLATSRDVPLITALTHQLAEVEGFAASCTATDSRLRDLLFARPPFQGPTVFILETLARVAANPVKEPITEGSSVHKGDSPTPEAELFGFKPRGGRDGGYGGVAGIQGEEASLSTNVEDTSPLEASASIPDLPVEMELFRSTSDVKYRAKFLSEISACKSSAAAEESQLQTHTEETNMEEPVLEVFRSTSDVNFESGVDAAIASQPAHDPVVEETGELLPRVEKLDMGDNAAEIIGEFRVDSFVEDPELEAFRSPCDGARTVVGFVHFFPNYSTYLAKVGMYMEALYIRRPYRRLGLGKMFLRKVAQEAVKLGMDIMEWSVLYSNDPAISFYEGLGAQIKVGVRRCVLNGKVLLDCKP